MSEERKHLDRVIAWAIYDNSIEELALGYLRYETLRKLNAGQFDALWRRNMAGERFDDMVTDLIPPTPDRQV